MPQAVSKRSLRHLVPGSNKLHHHLADVLASEEADERAHRLLNALNHRFPVFQFAGAKISAYFLLKFPLTIKRIANQQPFHREPLDDHVEEVGRTGRGRFRIVARDASTDDDPAVNP